MAANIPKTMKAAVVTAKGAGFTIVNDKPVPTAGKGQVLIKVEATSVCHSDMYTVEGIFPVQYPRIPGHEVIGRIVARGPDVPDRYKEGSRIGVGWHGGHCFYCDNCRAGNFIKCQNGKITGISHDGGHAEYMVSGYEALAFIPEDFEAADAAPLLCAGITVFNGIRKNGRIGPGDLVAVVGMGGLGSLAIQFATKFGARVVAVSRGSAKKDLCIQSGLREENYIDSSKEDAVKKIQGMGGAKCLVVVAPNSELAASFLPCLATDGTALMLSAAAEPMPVPIGLMIQKNARIQGHASGTAWDSEECVKFAHYQNIKPIVEIYNSLDKIPEAYARMMKGEAKFRGVIVFPKH